MDIRNLTFTLTGGVFFRTTRNFRSLQTVRQKAPDKASQVDDKGCRTRPGTALCIIHRRVANKRNCGALTGLWGCISCHAVSSSQRKIYKRGR